MRTKKLILILVIIAYVTVLILYQQMEDKENHYTIVSRLEDILDIDNAIIYFGRSTCRLCNDLEEDLNNLGYKNLKEIIYIDTDLWREDKYFISIIDIYEIRQVPTFLIIKNGVIVDKVEWHDSNTSDDLKFLLT